MSKTGLSSQAWQQQQQRTSSSSGYDSISAALLGKASSHSYSRPQSHGGKHVGGKFVGSGSGGNGRKNLKLPPPSHRGKSTKKINSSVNKNKSSASSSTSKGKGRGKGKGKGQGQGRSKGSTSNSRQVYTPFRDSSPSDADDDFDGFSDDDDEDDDDDDPSYGPGGKPIIHKPSNSSGANRRHASSSITKIKYSNAKSTGSSNTSSNNNSNSKPAKGGSKGKSITKGEGKTKSKVNFQRQQQTPVVPKATKSIPSSAALNDDDDDSSSISSVASMDTPSEISDDSDNFIERSLQNTHIHNADEDEDEDEDEDDADEEVVVVNDNDDNDDEEDDDLYEAVDDVSDDADELDRSVEQLEEQAIIQNEHLDLPSSSHLSDVGSTRDPQEYAESLSGQNGSAFGEQTGTQTGNAEASDRHVRFQGGYSNTSNQRKASTDTSSSSSDSDMTSDDDLMTDFLQQDSLDPDLRKIIESDADPLYNQRRSEFIVTHDYYNYPGNIYHTESDSSYQSDSSDYDIESDGGETTDEDYPPPATITHPRSLLRRDSSASLSASHDEANPNDTTTPSASTTTARPFRRRGPLRGTFVADPNKPVAVIAPNGTSLILIPPYASSRHEWLESAAANSLVGSTVNTALNSPTTTLPSALPTPAVGLGLPFDVSRTQFFEFDSDTDAAIAAAAAAAAAGGGGAGNGNGNGNGESSGQATGTTTNHPDSFFQFNALDCLDVDEDMEDCDDDSEALLNVDDFIDFGESSSDEEVGVVEEEDEEFVGRSTTAGTSATTLGFGRSGGTGAGEEKEDLYDSDVFATPAAAGAAASSSKNADKASDDTPSRRHSKASNNSTNSNNDNGTNEVILDAERLLNRLDGGVVTAFRQNHNRYHALIRLPVHKEFLPANSPSRSASNVSSVFRRTKFSGRPPRQRRRLVPFSSAASVASSSAAAAGPGAGVGASVAGGSASGYSTPVMDRKRTASSAGYTGSEAVRRKILDSSRRGSAVPSTPTTPVPSVSVGDAR